MNIFCACHKMQRLPTKGSLFVCSRIFKIRDQDIFYIVVATGVAVFYADQFKAVLAADGVFLAVAGLHGGVAVVFQAVQLNSQHRQFLAALLLVDNKIKPPGIKQFMAN